MEKEVEKRLKAKFKSKKSLLLAKLDKQNNEVEKARSDRLTDLTKHHRQTRLLLDQQLAYPKRSLPFDYTGPLFY